jgi:hypothetical protein
MVIAVPTPPLQIHVTQHQQPTEVVATLATGDHQLFA